MEDKDRIKEFSNWKRIEKGLYRYVIAAGACYEIIITKYPEGDKLTNASAILCISGDWMETDTKKSYFSREFITSMGNEYTLSECLQIAQQDYMDNVTEN